MAKGDSGRSQNQIDYQGGMAQNNLNNLRNQQTPQAQEAYNQYQRSLGGAQEQFGNIMGQYQNFMGRTPQTSFNPEYAGYQNFAQTGGFSPQNIQDIRARSVAPTRALYSQGMQNVSRANALAGGNMASAPAALSRMQREQGAAISDANVNANAGIAGMVQQGKLAGLGGMSGIDQARLMGELQNSGLNLGAINAQGQLYGTTPGMAGLSGNMLNAQNANLQNTQGLQNQLSLGIMGAQNQKAGIPGNYQQGMQNVGGTMQLIGQGARALQGLGIGGSPTSGITGGADPYSGIGAMGEGGAGGGVGAEAVGGGFTGMANGPVGGYGGVNNPWWRSLMPGMGAGGNGNYPYNDPTNPYYNMFNNPNAGQMNPYLGPVFGGGIGGGQGGFKGGAGGPI